MLARLLSKAGFTDVSPRAGAAVPIGSSAFFLFFSNVIAPSYIPVTSPVPRSRIWPGL